MANPLEFPTADTTAKPLAESTRSRRLISIVKPDDPSYQKYFQQYSSLSGQMDVNNVVASNRHGVFLFKNSENGRDQLNHIVYIYTGHHDPKKADPWAFELPVFTNIDGTDWKKLYDYPKLLDRANATLMECFAEAKNFYPWQSVPRGLVIDGSTSFGFEQGSFLGIRGSIAEVRPLMYAIQTDDNEALQRIQKHITASMIHEFTHRERDDDLMNGVDREIATHIAQFIFDPHKNKIFNQQLAFSLKRIEENRSEAEPQKPLSLYDKAQYLALLHIAGGLAKHNEALRVVLQSDQDPNKLNTLRNISTFIQAADHEYLHKNFLPEIMKTDNKQLLKNARELETEYGITRSVLEMK